MTSSVQLTPASGKITRLLRRMGKGNRTVEAQLFSLVYDELRRQAKWYMCRERRDHTLQPTALVHEAYLKLAAQHSDWRNREHFFGIAGRAMLRILVDHDRKTEAAKRVDRRQTIPFDETHFNVNRPSPDASSESHELLAIDEALGRLSLHAPRQGKVVELRFFGGCGEQDITESLGVSVRTIKRDWRLAKTWLYAELRRSNVEIKSKAKMNQTDAPKKPR